MKKSKSLFRSTKWLRSTSIALRKVFVLEVVRGQARCEKPTHLAGLKTSEGH